MYGGIAGTRRGGGRAAAAHGAGTGRGGEPVQRPSNKVERRITTKVSKREIRLLNNMLLIKVCSLFKIKVGHFHKDPFSNIEHQQIMEPIEKQSLDGVQRNSQNSIIELSTFSTTKTENNGPLNA
ncbi:hypothetical protein EVAR_4964_1 [Eumeta japonica]|uniref:Uncharacterized protein n=1 Tax=Eumeta variegata TaxID=151549 RepID=A0A4C1UZ33_EUMVA|nr:hypothetical protein EVAR_4964_1 [Eumeta japonica]